MELLFIGFAIGNIVSSLFFKYFFEDDKNKKKSKDDLLKRAYVIMEFHAGRCPLNIENNFSGSEEHLAEYREIIKELRSIIA